MRNIGDAYLLVIVLTIGGLLMYFWLSGWWLNALIVLGLIFLIAVLVSKLWGRIL